jgi:hypothetical protein
MSQPHRPGTPTLTLNTDAESNAANSDTFRNAYCNSDNNTDGYANARYTDSYAKSDAAAATDTLPSADTVVVR